MASSGYTAWNVTAGEVPTTAYWNILGANDASFNSGNGINDSAIITRHLAAHNVTNNTYVMNEINATNGQAIGQTWTNVSPWSGTLVTSGGDVIFHTHFTYWRQTSGIFSQFRIQINGATNYPSNTGWQQYTNELGSHKMCSRAILVQGLAASTYTIQFQAYAESSGTTNFDNGDWINMVATEYLR